MCTRTAATLGLAALLVAGCNVLDPYLAQPPSGTTYNAAVDALDNLQTKLSRDVQSEHIISAGSGLATLFGFGGAGISAIFHAANATILAFGTVGASGFAVDNLYGNRTQVAIYNAGLDAVACVRDAIAPVTTLHATLAGEDTDLASDAQAIGAYKAAHPGVDTGAGDVAIANANATRLLVQQRMARDDLESSKIMSAIRSIVATLNAQLTKVVPDAAALARVGSSLGGQITGIPQAGGPGPTGFGAVQPIPIIDPVLLNLVTATNDLIARAQQSAATTIQLQPITCKVADAASITAIAVAIPGGGTTITYQGSPQSYAITGGSGYYIGPTWMGPNPSGFVSVYIQSPSSLVIAPVSGAKAPAGSDYTFDVYDSNNNHLTTPLKLSVPAASQPPKAPGLLFIPPVKQSKLAILGLSGSRVTIAPGTRTSSLAIAGGEPPYSPSVSGQGVAAEIDANNALVLAANSGASGTYWLQIVDGKGTTLAPPLQIVVKPPPAAATLSVGGLINGAAEVPAGGVARLLVAGIAPYSTRWITPPPEGAVSAIVADNGHLTLRTTKDASPGQYTLEVTDRSGAKTSFPVNVRP